MVNAGFIFNPVVTYDQPILLDLSVEDLEFGEGVFVLVARIKIYPVEIPVLKTLQYFDVIADFNNRRMLPVVLIEDLQKSPMSVPCP